MRWNSLVRRSLPVWLAVFTMGCSSEADTPDDPPSKSFDQEMEAWVSTTMGGMTLEDKVSQLFVTYIYGQAADVPHPKNVEAFKEDTPAKVVKHYRPGGIIYFNNDTRDNIDNPRQIAAFSNGLQRAALDTGMHIPLFIATDQEMGIVTRVGAPATQFPGNMAVCAGRNADDAKQAAAITGQELRALGINLDFAPDADVNSNPLNPVIGVRSFSSDPALASEFVSAQVHGYQDSGERTQTVSSTAKHFPGHGDAATDSHTGLPVIQRTMEEWRQIDAPPFRAAAEAGIDMIMTAHIQLPKIDPSGEPSTLSHTVLTDMLRNEIGYKGLVITDSLEMDGVRIMHPDADLPVLALQAGADQLLMAHDLGLAVQSVMNAVADGRLSEARIDQSLLRILRAKFKRGILLKPFVNEDDSERLLGTPDHLATASRITDRTVTVLRNEGNVLPLHAAPAKVFIAGVGAVPTQTLTDAFTAHGSATTSQVIKLAPADADITAVVAAAKQADLVVVLTNTMTTAANASQKTLVDQLIATQKPVVAVATRNPYDATYAQAGAWLATYSPSAGSMQSVAKVLFGEVPPVGKLPVPLPAANDPATIVYPLGHGLTW